LEAANIYNIRTPHKMLILLRKMVDLFTASSNQIFEELADWNRILQDVKPSDPTPSP